MGERPEVAVALALGASVCKACNLFSPSGKKKCPECGEPMQQA